MNQLLDKSDSELKTDVLSELKYEPSVRVTDIGVTVTDGTVTLQGIATSYGEKWDAVRAAKRVAGVGAIADDIVVRLPGAHQHSDSDIANSAQHQIASLPLIPANAIKIVVRDAWITLEGNVEWWYQKNAAQNAVQHLIGVKGVTNLIELHPTVTAHGIEEAIQNAFKRSAVLDANKITVKAIGAKVTLSGSVRNYAEEEEAERAAWSAPGVTHVDNQLEVSWFSLEE